MYAIRSYYGGWGAPHWPKEYGGAGLSTIEQFILNSEFAFTGTPAVGGSGSRLLGPTVLMHGTEIQDQGDAAVIIALFIGLERRGRRPVGFYCVLLPLVYAPVRFFLDFLRATPRNNFV